MIQLAARALIFSIPHSETGQNRSSRTRSPAPHQAATGRRHIQASMARPVNRGGMAFSKLVRKSSASAPRKRSNGRAAESRNAAPTQRGSTRLYQAKKQSSSTWSTGSPSCKNHSANKGAGLDLSALGSQMSSAEQMAQ